LTDNTDHPKPATKEQALWYLRGFLDAHRRRRTDYPNSANDRHVRETGHQIASGCCSPSLEDGHIPSGSEV